MSQPKSPSKDYLLGHFFDEHLTAWPVSKDSAEWWLAGERTNLSLLKDEYPVQGEFVDFIHNVRNSKGLREYLARLRQLYPLPLFVGMIWENNSIFDDDLENRFAIIKGQDKRRFIHKSCLKDYVLQKWRIVV